MSVTHFIPRNYPEALAYIQSEKMQIIKRENGQLYSIKNMCFLQAKLNQAYYRQNALDLKMVTGVVGVRDKKSGQFVRLWGDYENGKEAKNVERDNYHVWLEDDEGRVYDIVIPEMVIGVDTNLRYLEVIEGRKKRDLKKRGIHYIQVNGLIPEETWEHMHNKSFAPELHYMTNGMYIKDVISTMTQLYN